MTDLQNIKPPLSNAQHELLKVFSMGLPENEMIELRRHIASFFLKRATDAAEQVAVAKGYDLNTIEGWLNED